MKQLQKLLLLLCLVTIGAQGAWADTTYGINISGVSGGNVTADKENASYGETVTLTLKPYPMNELTVVNVIGATSGKSMPLTKKRQRNILVPDASRAG